MTMSYLKKWFHWIFSFGNKVYKSPKLIFYEKLDHHIRTNKELKSKLFPIKNKTVGVMLRFLVTSDIRELPQCPFWGLNPT